MDALNQKIAQLINYLENNRLTKNHIVLSDDQERSAEEFIYNPEKSMIHYEGYDISYHNGDFYNEISLKFKVENESQLNDIYNDFKEQALIKAEKEIEEEKIRKAKKQKRDEAWEHLKTRIMSNSERFIMEDSENPHVLEPWDYDFIKNNGDVVFIVEANRFAQQVLWERMQGKSYKLEFDSRGYGKSVGKNPTSVLSYSHGTYRDHKIMFWEITSPRCDFIQVEEFLKQHLPHLFEKGNSCDADNFHRCIRHIDDLVDPNSIKFITREN